ncbi:hypothetical protein ACFLRN_01655 [Thermoproteota archaeon]
MWPSRDIAYLVLISVLTIVDFALVLQFFALFIALPGIAYFVDIFGSILTGLSFLLYRGRRWRMFAQGVLLALLSLPVYLGPGYGPFDFVVRISIIIKLFIVDVIFNSLYGRFERRNKLYWLTILLVVYFFTTGPAIDMLYFSLLGAPFEVLWVVYSFVFLMLPLIIFVAIVGGSIGYRIYRRVEKIV